MRDGNDCRNMAGAWSGGRYPERRGRSINLQFDVKVLMGGILTGSVVAWVLYRAWVTMVPVPLLYAYGSGCANLGLVGHLIWRKLQNRGARRQATTPTAPAEAPPPKAPAAATDDLVSAVQRLTGNPDELVGRRERDAALALISEHYAEERLTDDEYSERRNEALVARTRGDLDHALRNLPTT